MNNLLLKQDLSTQELAIVNSEMNNKQKSKGIAYLIWFFFGGIGGHRYYAGDIGMGIAMTLTLGGLGFWALIDVFFIGKRIERKNEELEQNIIMNVKSFNKN
ncbi:TM2 domain-containing protein [Lysinibacillus endophyticus]|uniref:TM2 domain-containing protein n=1 Tax=Ureibacillus endophyticus TaxID=1978490 RepID=A0A494YVG9_9BACL|nr:TM2 domain-containing protein [Lysinibacillus endophyticus]MCP1144490.1 TM2 domain-containing protein [Lysinibacillus endophyticus]RKQ14190.1 TM2 domain-containing protein [Lysinibacillus endophyticus]